MVQNNTDPLGGPDWDWDNPLVSKVKHDLSYYLGGSVFDDDRIHFAVGSSYNRAQSDEELNDGFWHHVVGVYDGSLASDNIKLYVDGELQSVTYNHTDNILDIPAQLSVGCNNGETGDCFSGDIDEVRIYNRALTPAEIEYLYQNP